LTVRHISPYCINMPSAGLRTVEGAVDGTVGGGPLAVVRRLGTDDRSSQRIRVVDAALRCVARQGIHKTTVDDVAREAGLSRATLYRAFPGGKEAVLAAVVQTEVARLFSRMAAAMGEASDLEEVLVAGMVEAARRLSAHPALRTLLEHEPGVVLPHLAFDRMDRVLRTAGDFAAPFLARWLEPDEAARAAEWAARVAVSYLACPRPGIDLTDVHDARHLVDTFVVPGIQALRAEGPAGRRGTSRRGEQQMTSREHEGEGA
jgi:AcrR family transcriptional regulator